MFQSCSQLALRILELLSIGLNKVRFICSKSSKAFTHFTRQRAPVIDVYFWLVFYPRIRIILDNTTRKWVIRETLPCTDPTIIHHWKVLSHVQVVFRWFLTYSILHYLSFFSFIVKYRNIRRIETRSGKVRGTFGLWHGDFPIPGQRFRSGSETPLINAPTILSIFSFIFKRT